MHRSWKSLLIAVLMLAIYGVGVYTAEDVMGRLFPKPSAAQSGKGRPTPSGLGRILPKDDIINIGGIPGDRIKTLYVTANKTVQKGEPLVEFASRDERQHELELATRQVAVAEARLKEIDAAEKAKLADLDVQATKAKGASELKVKVEDIQLPSVEEAYKYANDLLSSLRSLDPTRATVAAQDMQKAVTEASAAKARLDAAVASRDAARRQASLDKESFTKARAAAEAEFALSRTALSLPVLREQQRLAKLRYDRALLTADSDGRVLRVLAREGSTVGQEPILQLTSSNKLVVLAEVYVDAIKELSAWVAQGKGVQATMESAALEAPLRGTLVNAGAIAPIVARNSVTGFSPRADADRRIIEVRIELDDESSERAKKYVGLEVNVKFLQP